MSAGSLTQFLIDITRGARRNDFAADPDAVLDASPLDASERAAVRAQDVGALWRAGVHPMALLYFARGAGWSNERYYACLAQADAAATKDAPVAAPGPAAPAPPRTPRSSAGHARS